MGLLSPHFKYFKVSKYSGMTTAFEALAEASKYFEKICDGPVDAELFNEALVSVEACVTKAKEADLFSKNEEIDEYSTKALQVMSGY
jgi:hypothetical protein